MSISKFLGYFTECTNVILMTLNFFLSIIDMLGINKICSNLESKYSFLFDQQKQTSSIDICRKTKLYRKQGNEWD